MNENAVGRTDLQPEPLAMGYDSRSGRAWDNHFRPLDMDPTYLPSDGGVAFTSRTVPTSELLSSDPAPMAGDIDAGGPYGGPDTFEGTAVHFTAIVNNPDLIRFRWDFNNDGVWDTGDPASGNWVDELEQTHVYLDDYYDVVVLEAWDGISTFTTRYTGWSLGSPSPLWYLLYYYYWTVGYKFKAKETMTVNQLGFYRYLSTSFYGFEATLWDAQTQLKVAECSPAAGSGWRRCNLSSAVTLQAGKEYVVSMRLGTASFNFYYARGIDTPSDTDQVEFSGTYYTLFTPSPAFPGTFWADNFIPTVEFFYDYTLSFPITVADTADVEVNNIAPIVFDLRTNPSILLEGNPAEFSAMFSDPGLDDQWQFRWCFGDGTCDPWGGIRVGSGLSQLENILVYSDVAPHYASQALDFYGVNYEFTSSIFAMPGLITERQWDLIIYQSYFIAFIAPILEDEMMNQLAGGAAIMYNNWYAFSRAQHPILQYFGGQFQADLFSPLPMDVWEPSSGMFTDPLQTPLEFNPTHNQYFRDGQRIKVLSNAFDPLGYTDSRQTGQAAAVVRNDLTTIWNGFTPQNFQGDGDIDGDADMLELMVNEIRLVTGPEVPRTMPWPVPTAKHVYRDDHPTSGTPADTVFPTLELKDDDDGKLRGGRVQDLTDFEAGSPWPSGWSETQGFAWLRAFSGNLASQAATYWYYYDWSEEIHTLVSRSWDLSGMDLTAPEIRVLLTYEHSWQADYPVPWAYQDGYVEISTDGFATSYLLTEYHHFDPSSENGVVTYDITSFVAGASNVQARFTVQGYDDWWWEIDNVEVFAEWGVTIQGLATASTTVEVSNVEPKIFNGPTSGLVGEAIPFFFDGYQIDDPTLFNPSGEWEPVSTEWFAYRWDFDDGVVSDWNYKGSLELPTMDVLVLHTLSFGSGDNFLGMIRDIDLVNNVDQIDFLFVTPATIPTPDQMAQYDAVIFATNYATFSSQFAITRTVIGDYLAEYQELYGGAVITLMATYDMSPFYGDLFAMLGRYADEDFGAFEKTMYLFSPGTLGTIYDPSHPVMQDVARVTSPFIVSGDYELTDGAVLLADWDNGNSAIAVKEHPNGARSINIGGFSGSGPSICGGDCQTLIRNALIWASYTVVPDNDIVPLEHLFGDNGLYSVDLQVIDDDMGWEFDVVAGQPVPISGAAPTVSHTIIPIEIENVDPIIDTSAVEVYIAANVCLRVSGKEWNTVALRMFTDGVQTGGTQVTRASGSPNDQAKCAFTKIDLLASHVFSTEVSFQPLPGTTSGSNPAWVIIEPWRGPITPGHGTVTYSNEFNVGDVSEYTWSLELGNLKQALLDSGHGARIEFAATASDQGTDDLAFVWQFGDGSLDVVNIHNNLDGTVTQGAIGDPQQLGFGEPFFERSSNDVRSPAGSAGFTVRDHATHRYSGESRFFWVILIVLDDDNTRGYPSLYVHDGTDMEFILVDLT